MLIFAGILLAVFLRGMSNAVSRWTGLPEGWSLATVIITILLTITGLIWWLAPAVAEQSAELRRTVPASIRQGEV